MNKPICVKCELAFEVERMGVYVKEIYNMGIYKVWAADLLKCPKCGFEVIGAWGDNPLAMAHEDNRMKTVLEACDLSNQIAAVDKKKRVFLWREK